MATGLLSAASLYIERWLVVLIILGFSTSITITSVTDEVRLSQDFLLRLALPK